MKRQLFAFAILSMPCFLAGNAEARLLYVAPNGSDSANGTLVQPLATPSRAITLAQTGDRVLLRAGRYNLVRGLRLTKAGVILTAAPGEKVTIASPTEESGNVQQVVFINASNVTVANLEIIGGSYYGVKVDVDEAQTPPRGVVLRGLRIANTGRDCIKTFNADKLLIEQCNIGPSGVRDPSNAEGIDSIGSHGVTIRRSYIHDTATNGIYLKGGATDGLIEACRIENIRQYAGILLGQDTDLEFMRDGTKYEAIRCTARNNIIVNTGGVGMGTYSGDSINFVNNTLYNVARESGAGIWVGINRRNVPARKIRAVNNIIVTSGVRPFWFLLNNEGQPKSDYNLYYNLAGRAMFRTEARGQVTSLDLNDWKRTSGSDANSRIANPVLSASNSFKPRVGSPALGRGVRLQDVLSDFSGVSRSGRKITIGAQQ